MRPDLIRSGIKILSAVWEWIVRHPPFARYRTRSERTSVTGTNDSKPHRRLLGNIISLYLLQGLNYLIPMALLPFLVRTLGMEQYGRIAFSQSFAQYFVLFTDYGFNFSATRYIAQNRENREAVRAYFWQVMIIKFVLMFAGLFLLGGTVGTVPRLRHDLFFCLVAYLAVFGNVLFPQWYFQGMEKMSSISIYTGIAKLISAILIFVLVRRPGDALLSLALLSAGMVLTGLMGLSAALAKVGIRPIWPTWIQLKTTTAEAWHLFLATASISLYTNTNVFLVGLLAGNVQAGYFSAADKLIRAIAALIFPVLQAAYPHVSRMVQSSRQQALAFYARTVRIGGLLGIGACLLFLCFARPLGLILFGGRGEGIIPVLRAIAPFPALAVVTAGMGMLIFAPFGFEKIYSRLLLVVGVVNVIAGLILIPIFGAFGAAVGMIVTEAFQAVAGWRLLWRNGVPLRILVGKSFRSPSQI